MSRSDDDGEEAGGQSEGQQPTALRAIAGPTAAIPRARAKRKSAPEGIQLERIEIENLRNYDHAVLEIRPFTVVVGNNNEGKSSILRIADWVLNQADEEALTGKRDLSAEEVALLFPANNAHHRARRVSLYFRFQDGRKARAYQPESEQPKIVRLRLSIEKARRRARLNIGRPRKGEAADGSVTQALGLLRLIQRQLQLILVPSARDARSGRFRAAMDDRLQEILLSRFEHAGKQAGAPREYRLAKEFLGKIERIVVASSRDIVMGLKELVPTELMRDARLALSASPNDLAVWIREHLALTLTTGEHDANHVDAAEVGNGLQSLLDVALSLATRDATSSQVLLVLEEPEAFLHPGAQRVVAQRLRKLVDAAIDGHHVAAIVTTHSPYVVEEARFGEVALVRAHRFYQASEVEDVRRSEINTSLLTVQSAEMFFSDGVLLVEGPGDRALFQGLLRRYQHLTDDPALARLTVLDVGGKRGFVPWWRLLDAYRNGDDAPIRHLSLFDADAASKDGKEQRAILAALEDVGRSLPAGFRHDLIALGDLGYDKTAERAAQVKKLALSLRDLGLHIFSVDCEWAAFGGAADGCLELVQQVLESEHTTPHELARAAGSKVGTGKSQENAKKHPFRRQKLAAEIALDRLPSEVESVLVAWFSLVHTERQVRRIVALGAKGMS